MVFLRDGAHKPFPPPPEWLRRLEHVGVTGTNGKTSTTTFVAAALGCIARPVASCTTLGARLDAEPLDVAPTYRGVLETVRLALERGGRFAALEVTSEVLALGFARRWPFRVAVFTNLTHDHLDAHGSFEHYFASKAQLFNALPEEGGVAVVNGCDEVSELMLEVTPPGARRLAYGVASRGTPAASLAASVERVAVKLDGTSASVALGEELGGGTIELGTRAVGEIFFENALAAWVVAVALGASRDSAARAIAATPPPAGRFQVVAREPIVVVDYAHTPDALARTLQTARTLASRAVTVVFGAGGNRDRAKRPALGAAAAAAHRVVLTSDNPRDENPADIAAAIRDGVPQSVLVELELDRAEAIRRAVFDADPGDVVVIAGKGHEATQTFGAEARAFSDVDWALQAVRERGGDAC